MELLKIVIFRVINPTYTATILTGLTLGLIAILSTMLLMNGYLNLTEKEALGANSHVSILFDSGQSNDQISKIKKNIIDIEGVKAAFSSAVFTSTVRIAGVISGEPMGVRQETVVWKGVEISNSSNGELIKNSFKQYQSVLSEDANFSSIAKDATIRAFLNQDLLERLVIAPVESGDEIVIKIDSAKRGFEEKIQYKRESFVVKTAGIIRVKTGDQGLLLTSLENLKKVYGSLNLNSIDVYLKDPFDEKTLGLINSLLPEASIQFWREKNKGVYAVMRSLDLMIALLAGLILLIICFSIYTTLHITITEKRKVICLFKALGVDKKDVYTWFLSYGVTISLASLVLSVFIVTAIFSSSLIEFKGPVGTLFNHIDISYLYTLGPIKIMFAVLFFVLLSCFIPAKHATVLDPAIGLRED